MDMAHAAESNLRWLLQPMQDLLSDPAMTDLHINAPGVAFVDRGHGMDRVSLPYSIEDLEDIAINAAALTRQDIADDVPLVSTRFPDGHRVQIVRPPAVGDGQFAFSIRRPSAKTWTPEQLEQAGVFRLAVGRQPRARLWQDKLAALYDKQEWRAFLELAIAARLNIVFSGTVGSGKTFNMRSLTHAIPPEWRIMTIEDMPELIGLPCANVVNLLYSKGGQSVAKVTASDLVEAALRMGMDGLLVQELRDEAAFAFLNVLKSGHWGMSTTHADSGGDVFERIAGLVKQHPSGMRLAEDDLLRTLRRNIHVIVHCVRDGNHRFIEQVLYDPAASGIPLVAE